MAFFTGRMVFAHNLGMADSVHVGAVTEAVKGKAIPLQPWTGPEGSRRLRLPDFKTIGT